MNDNQSPKFEDSPSKAGASKVTGKDGKSYYKSTSANATVAPTNETTLDKVVPKVGLNEAELDFVTSVHWWFGMKGKLPTLKDLEGELLFKPDQVKRFINSLPCREALAERGLRLKSSWLVDLGYNPNSKEASDDPKSPLSPLQLVVANMMLDLTDTRSDRKKLQDAGVKTSTYQMWLRDPAYKEYLRERAEGLIGDVQHEALLSLVDRVRRGELNAIKYYHEFTGRFTEQKAQPSGSGNIGDLQRIIVSIVEIIVDEVEDPQVAARISDRLKGLITGNQLAGTLPMVNPQDPIVQPAVAEPRVITEDLKNLMERGMGYA